jgi:prepilin-type N-terminal cleavage/methylation domain-containing protein
MKKHAFSLIEISVVVFIIGILISGISAGIDLYQDFKLATARQFTQNSRVSRIDGLTLWLETTSEKSFEKPNPKDGDLIALWKDINPNISSQITASQTDNNRKPIYKNIDGLPILRFNGSSNNFKLTDGTIPVGNSAYTVFFVVKLSNNITATFSAILSAGMWVGHVNAFRYEASKFSNPTGNSSYYNLIITTNLFPKNKYVLLTAFYDNQPATGLKVLYINGVEEARGSVGWAQQTPATNNFIGNSPWSGDAENFYGDMGEIIIYNRALKIQEIKSIEKYLATKFNIKIIQ